MKQYSIDLVRLFKFSFHQFKKYSSFIIGIAVTYYVLAIIPQVYLMLYSPEEPSVQLQLLSVAFTVFQLFLGLGFLKILLLLTDDHYVEVADLFHNFAQFPPYLMAYLLYMIAVVLGLFLFVLPGIFIAIRFQFYPYYILEGTHSAVTALKKSYYQTENLTLELFLFGVVVVVLNILGALLFGIGIILTYPLTTMATAVVYKHLSSGVTAIPSAPYQL